MTLNKKHKLKDIYPAIVLVNAMYDKQGFSVSTLRRKFSPYFKTTQLENRFSMRLKGSEHAIWCIHEPTASDLHFMRVRSTKFPNFKFDFFVASNKEFMQKLLKHNLLY